MLKKTYQIYYGFVLIKCLMYLNALGNKHINTPRINALINDGVVLRNCYVQNQLVHLAELVF